MSRRLRSGEISIGSGGISVGGDGGSDERAKRRKRREDNNECSTTTPTVTIPPRDVIQCDCCSETIPSTADRVRISPCGHQLCTFCALQSQITRGSKPHNCPATNCNCYSTRCTYLRADSTDISIDNKMIGSDKYVRDRLPFDYLIDTHRDNLRNNNEVVVLHCTKAKLLESGGLKVNTVTSTLVIQRDTTNNTEVVANHMRALVEVQNFFAFLHSPIFMTSNTDEDCPPVLSPRELLDMRCQNRRILDGALYALSTGRIEFDEALFVGAADILLRSVRKKPGYLQLMLGSVMNRQRLTKECKDLLSLLHMAPSRSFCIKSKAKEVINQLKKGIKPSPRDLIIVLFDNIGFKILGRQSSYDQWIMVNVVVVTEKQLKEAGFYRDEDPESERISRAPSVDWKDTISRISSSSELEQFALAESIVEANEEDFVVYSKCVLESIKFVIDNNEHLSLDDKATPVKLSRFDRIIDEQTRNEMDQWRESGRHPLQQQQQQQQNHPSANSALIPRDYLPSDVNNELVSNIHRCVDRPGCVGDDEVDNRLNLQPLHEDLSKTSSVASLMTYAQTSGEQQRAGWESYKEKKSLPDSAELPLANNVIVALGTDGQPAAQALRLLEEDTANKDFSKNMLVSFGGFHSVMKFLNASGEYFEELLTHFFSVFRDSIDRVKWILHPSDPRQREEEYPWYALAMYHSAHKALVAHLNRPVSAVEVNTYMLERAQEYPICALVLLELRIGEIGKLMRNSERIGKRGSVQLFLTAVKLALPLFALTNKSDYVFLCTNLLKWYHCASPAQRKIYESFIFTQVTAHNKPVFHDAFVEIYVVMPTRQQLGKVYRRGLELGIESAAATISNNGRVSDSTQTLRGDTTTAPAPSRSQRHNTLSNTDVACPFYLLVEEIEAMKLFTHGANPIIKKKGGGTIECSDTVLQVPGGGEMHASILSALTTVGRERVKKHFVEYDIKGGAIGGSVVRSNNKVDLSKIDTTVDRIRESLDREIVLLSRVKAFTKKVLTNEVKSMQDRESRREDIDDRVTIPNMPDVGMDQMIAHLIQHRGAVFDRHPTLKDEMLESIKNSHVEKGMSTRFSREELLQDKLFSLSDPVTTNERYTSTSRREV